MHFFFRNQIQIVSMSNSLSKLYILTPNSFAAQLDSTLFFSLEQFQKKVKKMVEQRSNSSNVLFFANATSNFSALFCAIAFPPVFFDIIYFDYKNIVKFKKVNEKHKLSDFQFVFEAKFNDNSVADLYLNLFCSSINEKNWRKRVKF